MKTLGVSMLVALMALAMVPATAETLNWIEPFDVEIPPFDCIGEWVAITGEAHYVVSEIEDGAGGYHYISHENIKGQGVGLDTGDKYQFNEAYNSEFNVAADDFPFVATSRGTIRVIGQGKAPNFLIDYVEHITVNAGGEITVAFSDFEERCM